MNSTDEQLEQVVRRLDPRYRLERAWPLAGGVSAQMIALQVALPGGAVCRMVVRCHGEADRAQNPHVAADEFRLLQVLRSLGFAVPAPYALDTSGQILPTPYLVIEYVEGRPEFAPADLPGCLSQMAEYLARLHRIDGSAVDLSFLPRQGRGYGEPPAQLDGSLDEGRIRDALAALGPLAPRNQAALLHGDFWPGNVLWREGQIAAVIDWEDARVGDPLCDLGNSRLEILWAFGREAMARFTEAYRSFAPAVDLAHLAYWDLCAALRPAGRLGTWGLDEATEQAMRDAHRWFVEQAMGDF